MNSIYIESEKILARKDIVEWLDGCGAEWCSSGCKFSKFEPFGNWYVLFDSDKDFSQSSIIPKDYTHCQTPEQFCELIADSLGIDKPVFGEPTKGIAIEVSRLSEEDKSWLRQNADTMGFNVIDHAEASNLMVAWAQHLGFESNNFYLEHKCTITDSPKVFMQYVASQTGKEYKLMNQDDKCMKCGNPIGNTVFTVCDNCWDVGKKSQDISSYPHKTYRILDSLDGIPLDKRFKLSEWIPPIGKKVLLIVGDLFMDAYFDRVEVNLIFDTSTHSKGIKPEDGEWMRIV